MIKTKIKRRKVAWGITGGGDKLHETISVMKKLRNKYQDKADVWVFLSRAGEHVAKLYGTLEELRECFDMVFVELNANVPFLAGSMQTGKFEFLIVAPASSNTIAKVAVGIADTMLTSAVIMGLKANREIIVMPTDCKEGKIVTTLPNGRELRLRIRSEDVENVEKLRRMDGMTVIEGPQEIPKLFKKHFD
jgi:archaeoflavoprotein AfpA